MFFAHFLPPKKSSPAPLPKKIPPCNEEVFHMNVLANTFNALSVYEMWWYATDDCSMCETLRTTYISCVTDSVYQ
jgi:hypothetical protein